MRAAPTHKEGKMKRILSILIGVCLAFTMAGAAGAAGGIKLGVISSQTGWDAANGSYINNGIKMAVEEINQAGGIEGKKIELIFEDDQGSTEVAVTGLTKILSAHPDVNALLLPVLSTMVLAMEQKVGETKVPALFGATNVKITQLGNPWLFRVRPSDAISAAASPLFAVKDLKAKTIGVLHSNEAFGTGGAEIVVKTLKEKFEITPAATLSHNKDDKEFTAQLMTFKSKNVDTILTWDLATPSGFIAKQIRQLGLKVNVVGSPAWIIPDVLELAGSAANGTYAVNDGIPWDDRHPDKKIAASAQKYKKIAKGYSNFGGAYYDAVYLLANAMKTAHSTDRDKIRQALLATKGFAGVANEYSFNKAGEGVSTAAIVKVKDGRPDFVVKVTPTP
jgi:branched-chain amino acid transport system substrate-binding protein